MKKVLFFIAVLVAGITLTSFVVNKQSSDDDWIYYNKYTAYYDAKDATPIYIYYKQTNSGRIYGYSLQSDGKPYYDYIVKKNKQYNHQEYGKYSNYRYVCGCCWYLNANLPYFN